MGAVSSRVCLSHQCRSRPSGRWGVQATGRRVARVVSASGPSSAAIWIAEFPPPTHDHPLPREHVGVAVVGGVQDTAAELRTARDIGEERCTEVTGRGDHRGRGELPPVLGAHPPHALLAGNGSDGRGGAYRGGQPLGVGAQVARDVVAAGVAVRVAGEAHAGQGGVPGRGEQGEAVVVARPGPARLPGALQHQHAGEAVSRGQCRRGETGLPGTDDDEISVFHENVDLP